MYAYIKGTLEETGEDYIVVEAGGIGYQIFTTGQTFQYLPSMGEEVKVYTYLHVREDAMILFGFLTKDDLFVFRLLLGVSGIGPKGALAILSVMTTDDLRFAVLGDDAKAIAKAPGVGAKTAQRLRWKRMTTRFKTKPKEQKMRPLRHWLRWVIPPQRH